MIVGPCVLTSRDRGSAMCLWWGSWFGHKFIASRDAICLSVVFHPIHGWSSTSLHGCVIGTAVFRVHWWWPLVNITFGVGIHMCQGPWLCPWRARASQVPKEVWCPRDGKCEAWVCVRGRCLLWWTPLSSTVGNTHNQLESLGLKKVDESICCNT